MIKNIILGLAISGTTLIACSGKSNKSTINQTKSNDIQTISRTDNTPVTTETVSYGNSSVSVKGIVSAYIQLKNAFTQDNSAAAATVGKELEIVFKNFDKTTLTAAQKKIYEDVEVDAREHAEHIGANSGNIEHQREHFELLSKDIYDLVKAFGGGQILYKDFCPMYNNGKGAFWLSETKEIKNPYLGKTMPTCGTIKEEIK
jgi:hypothetical protein